MKALDYEHTATFISFVLNHDIEDKMRENLHIQLRRIKSNEGQFYAGIVEHGIHMNLTSEQWFKLLSRLPNRILRSELPLRKILSPRHITELPPSIG